MKKGAPVGNRHSAKYNQKRHEKIIEGILSGNSRTVSFTLSGCNPDTIFAWLKTARDEKASGVILHPEYAVLLEDIEYAEAMVESEKVKIVKAAADSGTWQAAAWWLERRKPKEWGRDREMPVGEERPALPQVNILILEDANAREASRELLNRLAGGRADLALGSGALREPAEVD